MIVLHIDPGSQAPASLPCDLWVSIGEQEVGAFRKCIPQQKNPMMQRLITASTSLLLVAAVIGCGSGDPQPGDTIKREGEPPVVYSEEDDPKMVAAIEKARSTADEFIAALNDPQPSQSGFSVKVPVRDGDQVEHMWILPVRYEDGQFIGTINNEPDRVATVQIGDEVKYPQSEISDWMYLEGMTLVGGFTIRALRDTMAEEERAEFDRSVPFRFD